MGASHSLSGVNNEGGEDGSQALEEDYSEEAMRDDAGIDVAFDEESDEKQYRDAVKAMERGDESGKTKIAYYKLSGLGGELFRTDQGLF